ncbi:MAG: hypothetical protein R2731_17480 [Nocardioides sp.]
MKRTTSLLVSAVLMAPAVQLAASPAQSAPPRLVTQVAAAPASAKPTRTVTIAGVNKGRKVWVKGKVSGGYKHKRVIILKRKCTKQNGCAMVKYSRVRTDDRNRYKARVQVPDKGKVKYQAKVKASGGYAVSFSPKITLWWS